MIESISLLLLSTGSDESQFFLTQGATNLLVVCGAMVARMECIQVFERNERGPLELFHNISPGKERNLKVFGEMVVFANHANTFF